MRMAKTGNKVWMLVQTAQHSSRFYLYSLIVNTYMRTRTYTRSHRHILRLCLCCKFDCELLSGELILGDLFLG